MSNEEHPVEPTETTESGGAPTRLSAGVGPMEEPVLGEGPLEFNPDARSGAYVFRAGSALPEDTVPTLEKRLVLLRDGDELYSVDPAELETLLGAGAVRAGVGTTRLASDGLRIDSAVGVGAVPELLQSIGTFNIVKFDGRVYGLPQSLGAVEWGRTQLLGHPEVFVGTTLHEVVRLCEEKQGIPPRGVRKPTVAEKPKPKSHIIPLNLTQAEPVQKAAPRLVGSIQTYNIVEYEGWFYGLPQSLGPIDLTTTDVIEMAGVIRDVSKEVVEGEIREVLSVPPAAAN